MFFLIIMPSTRRVCLRNAKAIEQETRDNSHSNDKLKSKNNKIGDPLVLDEDLCGFESLFFEKYLKQNLTRPPRKYVYLFSERYENIETLLNSIGKSLKVKSSLPEFQIPDEKMGHKITKNRSTEIPRKTPFLTQRIKMRMLKK